MALRRILVVLALMASAAALPSGAVAASWSHEVVDSAGPVIQYGVTPDLNCSARYTGDTVGEFFGGTSCVTAIATPDAIYAPASIPAGSGLTNVSVPFSTVSQQRAGTGSSGAPFAITTTVVAGDLRLTQVDSYVVGSSRLQTTMSITNTSAQPITFDVFRAGDCYARDSDFGFGQMGPQSAACVSSFEARTVRFLATPLAPAPQPEARTFQSFYGTLWERIATFAPGGARLDFDGSCRCAEDIDNAAGLQWRLTLASGQQTTIGSAIDFGPIATPGGFGAPIGGPPAGGRSYVALGDSYSSGEGAGDQSHAEGTEDDVHYNYIAPSNQKGNRCHRSSNAYPRLLADRIPFVGGENGLDFVACSGALIKHLRGPNDADHGLEAAQLGALGADTKLATLTIGGNDANFSGIVKSCALPTLLQSAGCDSDQAGVVSLAYQRLGASIGPESLALAYQEVMGKLRADASLAVFGYPDFVPFGGGCQTADRFSEAESVWLSGWIRTFNTLIEQRAAWAGAIFVDVDRLYQPPNARSHRICSGDEWVNGIRGPFPGKVDPESVHPNKLGQKAYAEAGYRRIVLGESNEALSGPSQVTFSRENQVAAGVGASPTTVVIRKGVKTAIGVDVTAGYTTVASLRYDDAAPTLELLDPLGNPVPIGAIDPNAAISRALGATSIRVGNTTVVELRQLQPGRFTLNASLPDDAPTAAGVLSARFTSLAETNLAPNAAVNATLDARRRLKVSSRGSIDPEGSPLGYRWEFGDRRSDSMPSLTHRYRKAGRYSVTLTVSDQSGGTTRRSLVVETRPQTIAGLRVRRSGKNKLVATLSCTHRTAVEACQTQLRAVIRTSRGRRTVRTVNLSARPGRRAAVSITLPGTRKRPFAGTARLSGVAADSAVRASRQRLVASLAMR